jgi:hypothetical protein
MIDSIPALFRLLMPTWTSGPNYMKPRKHKSTRVRHNHLKLLDIPIKYD